MSLAYNDSNTLSRLCNSLNLLGYPNLGFRNQLSPDSVYVISAVPTGPDWGPDSVYVICAVLTGPDWG